MTEYAKSFEIIKSDDLQQAKARAKMSTKKEKMPLVLMSHYEKDN